MEARRFLGIDYGTKRIGLAISDERGTLAFPKAILDNDKEALENIRKIVDAEGVREIVMGESLDFKGRPNAVAADIRVFMDKLAELGIPIHTEKEFLTSVEARRSAQLNKNIDDSAAALILQRYLDRRSVSGNR